MVLDNNDKIKLKNLGVNALILFGSQAQGIAGPMSDYDFFVIGKKTDKMYDAIYDIVSDKIGKPTNIDIVFEENSPMELQNHVAKYGKVLFEVNGNVFANFRERVMIQYADFEPYRNMYSNATIARI